MNNPYIIIQDHVREMFQVAAQECHTVPFRLNSSGGTLLYSGAMTEDMASCTKVLKPLIDHSRAYSISIKVKGDWFTYNREGQRC